MNEIVTYIISGALALIGYLGKILHRDYKTMQKDITRLNYDLSRVETDSKRYWNEHKREMENNQKLLMERIQHYNDNQKASVVMIKEMFEHIEKRLDKLENKN